ncbi:nuclear envelope phosphatase-regulatory subunit 1 isoform X1 [Equus quagga]|nr:nuclear envelope phosphatase-regulatory subunit 1 isoform X1 [Equus quagga]
MNSLEQAEDLKAFERRLTEYIHCLQPATGRWRMLLIVVSVCTATGAWNWLIDPETQKVSFFTSLWNHPFFTISCITLIGLFFAGIHKRVVAPSIIAARCRTVLAEYNMSCDDPPTSRENPQDSAPRPGLAPPILSSTPARSPLQPPPRPDTPRACALLPHVGSGRQRA